MSVALVIQHAKCTRPFVLSSVACPALQDFCTLSHKRHDCQKKKLLNIKCVLIFSAVFVWNISHYKKNSGTYYHECLITQIDNCLIAASYQETASYRYTAHWYVQLSPMVQNHGHSPWRGKSISSIWKENLAENIRTSGRKRIMENSTKRWIRSHNQGREHCQVY